METDKSMKEQARITVGALILAGGQNSRMDGRHKALLEWNGKTYLSYVMDAFAAFDEKIISTGISALAEGTGFQAVPDEISGQGPLGGLSAALSACCSDALVVCACDMPFVTAGLTAYLARQVCLHPEAKAIAIRDRSGRLHPLCGAYRKEAASIIHKALMQDERRMIRIFRELQGMELSLAETEFPDRILSNVNTPEEMEALKYHTPAGQPRISSPILRI